MGKPTGNMFQQTPIPIFKPAAFGRVKTAIDETFAPPSVESFLKRVQRVKLQVRNFEKILEGGLLGDEAKVNYSQLGDTDRGQIRELYLSSVEQVTQALRGKYLKVYAYY